MSGEHHQQGGFTEQPHPGGHAEGQAQRPNKPQPVDTVTLGRLLEGLRNLPNDDKPAAEATVEDAKALREDLGEAAPDYRVVSPLASSDTTAEARPQESQDGWYDRFGWFAPYRTDADRRQDRLDRHQIRLAKLHEPIPPVSRGRALEANKVERLALPATQTPVPEFDPTMMSWDRARKAQTAAEAHDTANRIQAAYVRSRTFPKIPVGALALQFDPLTATYPGVQETSNLILQEPIYDGLLKTPPFYDLQQHLTRTTRGRHARVEDPSTVAPTESPQLELSQPSGAVQPYILSENADQVNEHAQVAAVQAQTESAPQAYSSAPPPAVATVHSISSVGTQNDQPKRQSQMLMQPAPPPAKAAAELTAGSLGDTGELPIAIFKDGKLVPLSELTQSQQNIEPAGDFTPLPTRGISFTRKPVERIDGPMPLTDSGVSSPVLAPYAAPLNMNSITAAKSISSNGATFDDTERAITGPQNLRPAIVPSIPAFRPPGPSKGPTTYGEGTATMRRPARPVSTRLALGGRVLHMAGPEATPSELWVPDTEPATSAPEATASDAEQPAILHFADGSHTEMDMPTVDTEATPAKRRLGKIGRSALLGAGIFAAGVWAGRRRR